MLEAKPMTRTEIKKWLRSEGLDPRDMIELAEIIAPAFPARLERRRAHVATGGKGLAAGETERFAKEFLKGAKRRPKPRVVVISPRAVARVVEAIYKRHPEIRDWLAERGLTVEDGTNLLFKVLDYTAPRDRAAFSSSPPMSTASTEPCTRCGSRFPMTAPNLVN